MPKLPHLTPEERKILLSIVSSHPRASTAMIARIFRSRTGRPIAYITAYRARHWGYGDRDVHPRLTPGQREILARLVEESAPEYSRSEVASAFAALAGRPISLSSVSKFMINSGLPRIPRGKGTNNRGVSESFEAARIAARIAAAEDRKRARVPDRRRIPGRSVHE